MKRTRIIAILALIAATQMNSAPGFIICFSIATFGVDMTLSPSWTFCMDIDGRKSGAVSGTMNMLGK